MIELKGSASYGGRPMRKLRFCFAFHPALRNLRNVTWPFPQVTLLGLQSIFLTWPCFSAAICFSPDKGASPGSMLGLPRDSFLRAKPSVLCLERAFLPFPHSLMLVCFSSEYVLRWEIAHSNNEPLSEKMVLYLEHVTVCNEFGILLHQKVCHTRKSGGDV